MPYVQMFDEDPDEGPARMMVYEVLNVTGPGSISLVGDMRQKLHPLDAVRRQMGGPDASAASGPTCRTPGCTNRSSERHTDCSTCRSKRVAKCACGRRRSYGATRCLHCAQTDRRLKKIAAFQRTA